MPDDGAGQTRDGNPTTLGGQHAGFEDFWRIYDAHFDAIIDSYPDESPIRSGPTRAASRERVQRAAVGDWEQYDAYQRAQATILAQQGLSLGAWRNMAGAFSRTMTPLLVREYHAAPARLTAALLAMQELSQRGLTTLGDAYVAALDTISRERQDKTDHARRLAEGRFTRLAESGIIGIVVARLDGRVIEINDAALAVVGRSREELVSGSTRWSDLTPPEWRDLDQQAIAQLQSTGTASLREKEYLHTDGHRVPVLVGSATLHGAASEVISFILDLTDRKRADAAAEHLRAIHAADAVFRTMVDSVTDYAIFMLDPLGLVATWNSGAARLKEYKAEEIIGKHFSIFYTSEDQERGTPASELQTALAEGRSEMEGWRLRRDGSRFWANVVISAMRGADGQLLGFSKVTRDLTARKNAELALNLANQELEAFSYSVAHDLRAPLRGMNGFARLLLDNYGAQFDDEGKDWLNEILLNAKKMASLIDALLSLARVTRSPLNPEEVDLSSLASNVARELARANPDHAVDLVVEPRLLVSMDPLLADALIENLVGNAWKFTVGTSQPRIEVGAIREHGSSTFFVRDNGAGFDMAYADKLFAPFQRLHTVAEFPGTGIGLATVQRIIHRHGGRVWAEGAVGCGATFFFTLPREGQRGAS